MAVRALSLEWALSNDKVGCRQAARPASSSLQVGTVSSRQGDSLSTQGLCAEMATDQHSVDGPRDQVGLRWLVLEHAQAREQANIAAALVDFSDVPPAVALDLYYKVADRAAAPPGQPGGFPRNDLRGLDKFLRGELRFQLLHYKRDRRRAVPDPEDILAGTTAPSDPAREVEQRQVLRDIAQIVNDELANADLTPAARAYFVADRIEGLKRAEIQRHLGWSEHRIKRSRRELREHDAESLWRAMVARIHDALTNVLPVPVLRLLIRDPGGPSAGEVAAGAAGGTLLGGAGVKIAVACLASLACGGALYAGLDRPHIPPSKTTGRTQATRTPPGRQAARDRPTRGTISTPTPSRSTPTSSRAGSRRSQTSGTSSNMQDAPRQAPEFSFEGAASGSSSTATSPSAETQSAPSTASARAPSTTNHEFGFER